MKKLFLTATALCALSLSAAHAAQPTPVSYRTTHYRCDGGQRVSVKSVHVGNADFAVVNYKGKDYSLAPAVSASGARYVGLSGLALSSGLEWVEWKGKGFLNSFPTNDLNNTTVVLNNCVARR